MKKNIFSIIATILLGSILFITGCSKNETTKDENKKPLVVTTIGMIADAVQNIAGDEVELKNLMGSGVDPHLYKTTAGDAESLRNADLILYSGIHLEAKMADVLKKLASERFVVAVSETIPEENLISVSDAEHDPHVWFDVKLWSYSVKSVYDSLCKLLPEKTEMFTKNYNVYKAQMDELDKFITQEVSKIPAQKRVIVTAHDAFNYFSKAYNFEVKGLQGVSTVTEASTRDVQDLADLIAKRKIPAIFIESSVPHKNVEALQAAVQSRGYDVQIGGELFSDAMGDAGTFEGTYIGMVTHNVNTIVSALSKD